MKGFLRNRFSLIWLLILTFLAISFLTRVVLLITTHASGITGFQGIGSFFIGVLYDLAVAGFVIIPFVLQVWLQNDLVYRKAVMPFVCIFFGGIISGLLFTGVVPKDFNPEL